MNVKNKISGMKLGVIGNPSDWLIASHANHDIIKEKLGVELVDIPLKELSNLIEPQRQTSLPDEFNFKSININSGDIKNAIRVYHALKELICDRGLDGGTIRCFDLIGLHKTTACLAVAKLNAEGKTFGCEGDVPALISMVLLKTVSSRPVFMANPSKIDINKNEILLAHCTLPLDMADDVQLDTHFETGLGVGVQGKIRLGTGTLFKISGSLDRYFISDVDIIKNTTDPDHCRTQVLVRLKKGVDYFLKDPIGNHHILCNGGHAKILSSFLRQFT